MSEPGLTRTSCEECPLHTRRDFVRDTLQAVALSIGAAALPSLLPARPAFAKPSRVDGVERRYPLPAADSVTIDRDADIIVARAGANVYAFSLACPHQRTALRWEDANDRFRCPKHKSIFTADGALVEGKATRHMDRFAVRRDGAALVVDDTRLYRFDRQPAEWAAAVVRVAEK